MIHLENINRSNWRKAVFITTDPEHKCPLDEQWVTSTAFSMVQSIYEEQWQCRLVLDDEMAIGFVFFGMWEEKQAPLLCRFSIDVEKQGKGYGQKALPVIVEEMIKEYNPKVIYLTLEKENKRAVHIYEKFGFVNTGEVDEGEQVYAYKVKQC